MTVSEPERRQPDEPGAFTRGHWRAAWDVFFRLLRFIAKHTRNIHATLGIFLLIGAAFTIAGTWAFATLAGYVVSGSTQGFDDRTLRWIAAHRNPALDAMMLEITSLGTGTVVLMIVAIAGMFLWLNRHKHSALLLVVAALGSLLLNNLLKAGFSRPRPEVVTWATHASFYSFPSGHAMSATVVYSTVAYLAARLQRTYAARIALIATALVIILLICVSRLYLGVHFPSDVIAGVTIGFAWTGFCMAALEGIQLYARRSAPELLREEKPAPEAPPEPEITASATEPAESLPGAR